MFTQRAPRRLALSSREVSDVEGRAAWIVIVWRQRPFTRMATLGEVGEFGLNHIPAKNAACESGPEGSNPSLSATKHRAQCARCCYVKGMRGAVLDRDARLSQESGGLRQVGGTVGVPGIPRGREPRE